MQRIVFALAFVAIAPFGNGADHWPAWRGPAGNGVAPAGTFPPLTWNDTTHIRWKAELEGRGSATPIVWENQVFVVTAVKTDRMAKPEELPKVEPKLEAKTDPPTHFYRFDVLSFDRTTGKRLWKQSANEAVPHEGHHPTHSYAAGSPTTDGRRLYVSFGSFGIFAYDLQGQLLWKRDLGRIRSRLGWGEAVTPVIHGDSLILNWDQEIGSKLIVLDAATGKTKWEVPRDEKTSWNTPAVVTHNGRTQVIVNGTNRVRSYDLADGKPIWEVGGMTVNAIPSPLVADGVAYVMSGYRGAAAVAVPLDATGDLSETNRVVWTYKKGTPYVPSPVLFEGRLYFTQANTQVLTILDAKTGKPILEGERLPRVGSFYASPVVANKRLYFVDRDGTTLVLSTGDKPEVLATNRLNDKIDASPAFVGKTLFLRGEKFLYAIEE
jgi:outer membrane protein assembly factor BamB